MTIVVVHYWAEWNLHDREMDRRIAVFQNEFAGRIRFRSCDVDRAENFQYIQGVANVPALGCFIRGRWFQSLVGLRTEAELRQAFERWLALTALSPAAANVQGG